MNLVYFKHKDDFPRFDFLLHFPMSVGPSSVSGMAEISSDSAGLDSHRRQRRLCTLCCLAVGSATTAIRGLLLHIKPFSKLFL